MAMLNRIDIPTSKKAVVDRIRDIVKAALGMSASTERIIEAIDAELDKVLALGEVFALAELRKAEAAIVAAHAELRRADAAYLAAQALADLAKYQLQQEAVEKKRIAANQFVQHLAVIVAASGDEAVVAIEQPLLSALTAT